ncbi:MAG TPA: hypothetical protein VF746_11685 [Longimicrobium sp.]|jgi:hypothetical protein
MHFDRSTSRRFTPLRRLAGLAALALMIGVGACASAGKRYEQGVELEQRGRPADAARRYIDALEKDPRLADARARLQETGDRAVQEYVAYAQSHEASGDPGEAAESFLRADNLRRDAAAVGVTLNAPADYPSRRRATFDRAIAHAVQGAAAAARTQPDEADRALARAMERWEPTPTQRQSLARARVDAAVAASEADLAQGRYRAAYDRLERLRQAVAGADPAQLDAARRVQEEALRRGTLRVAVLPVFAAAAEEGRLPGGFLTDLQDELETGEWMRPPRFVEVVDPREVRREWRRRGDPRRVPSSWEAERLGRALGAAVVVMAEIDSVARLETDVRSTRRPARTQAGADTAYTVREGRQTTWARVSYSLVDVQGGRTLERGTVAAEGGARFRRATFAGDWRTLALSRDERELFLDDRRGDIDRELARELLAGLSDRLGREVYDLVLRRVD